MGDQSPARIVKVRLTDAEQHLVKIAAAIDNRSIPEFARLAVLEVARARHEHFRQSTEPSPKPGRAGRSKEA